MANFKQGRAPEETSAPGSGFTQAGAQGGVGVSAPAVVYVRLWTPPPPAGQTLWKSGLLSVNLTLDVIASSGAEPQTSDGSVVLAEYPSAIEALLAARRLQWAFQGLVEQEPEKHSGAAVLICSGSEVCSGDDSGAIGAALTRALETANPGQIILSGGVVPILNGLPGVLLAKFSDSAWQEILWKGAAESASATIDEEQVRKLLKERGKEDPGPAPIPEPAQPAAAATVPPPPASRPISGSRPVSVSRPVSASRPVTAPRPMAVAGQTPIKEGEPSLSAQEVGDALSVRADRGEPLVAGSRLRLIFGGLAAAVVLAAGITYISLHHKPEPQATPAPIQSGPAIPTANAPQSPSASKPSPSVANTKKPSKLDPAKPDPGKTSSAPAKPSTPESCDLTEGEIPRSLQRAENDMHAGRLDEAKDAFLRLRGCSAARDRAEEGLRLTQARIDAQKN